MKRILSTALIVILFASGCSNVAHFIATGKPEPREIPITLTADQVAVNIAILKCLSDDTWTLSDIRKEIRYQQHLNRQKGKK